MEVKKRFYTLDDVCELQCRPGNADKHFELIKGELIATPPANLLLS